MLIISIMMLLRKKTQLRIAYALLAATAASLIAYDFAQRSEPAVQNVQTEPMPPPPQNTPGLPILPIAQSPFREANREAFLASHPAPTSTETKAPSIAQHRSAQSGVYFLKVAVEVPSKHGPLALNRGTRVRLVREQDGKLRVRRNTTDFLIEKSQVTDDLNELSALARNSS